MTDATNSGRAHRHVHALAAAGRVDAREFDHRYRALARLTAHADLADLVGQNARALLLRRDEVVDLGDELLGCLQQRNGTQHIRLAVFGFCPGFLPPPAITGPELSAVHAQTTTRQRRKPEESVLYQAVQSCWATSLTQLEAGDRHVPRFCCREVEAFLRCGILAHGFARVWCQQCRQNDVVAFSCKGRGFCPSCGTRRMVDTAALLVDQVIPDVAPVRQWVLSLPYRVRLLCAHDPMALSAVRAILVRAVSGYYERAAKRLGKPLPRTGAVAFVQRFDSALRLNVHLHVLWLDGVFSHEPGRGGVEWCQHEQVSDADVALLVRRVRDRVRRKLRKMGKWPEDDDAVAGGDMCDQGDNEQLLLELGAGAMQGVAVSGKRRGQRDLRIGKGTRNEPFVKSVLCADLDGFSACCGACRGR